MNSQIFIQPPIASIVMLLLACCFFLCAAAAYTLKLKAENKALKLAESVQKTRANDFEAKSKALLVENQKLHQELLTVKEQNDLKRLAIQMFCLLFNTLQLSQQILENLFSNDPTVRASASGPMIRKMFEFVTHLLLPSNFLDSGNSIDIILHTGINQFMEFSIAFAKFIYASNMELPGCDFIVCSISEPKKAKRKFSSDGSRVYEFVKFEVSFYCRNTRKTFKIVFSCDHGRTFPQEDFVVNSLTFDSIRGFSSLVNGSPVPVLQIIMGIINQRAQWTRLPDAHFSGIRRVLELRSYVLHGCPFVTSTDFCPFSQEKSKYALEFSGCRCGIDRSISIGMICGFLKSNPNSPLRCPFCKEILPNLTHEPDCDPASKSFDLSCIEDANFLRTHELRRLQEEGRSIRRIFGVHEILHSELRETIKELAFSEKVFNRRSHLPDLPNLSEDEEQLFFPLNSDEDSEPEPEPESEDDDQSDLGNWRVWQDWIEPESDGDDHYDQGDQDDQGDYQGDQDDQGDYQGNQDDQGDQDDYDENQGDQYYPCFREVQQVQQVQQDRFDNHSHYSSDSSDNESDNPSNNDDEEAQEDSDAYDADQDDQYRPNASD